MVLYMIYIYAYIIYRGGLYSYIYGCIESSWYVPSAGAYMFVTSLSVCPCMYFFRTIMFTIKQDR